MMSTTFEMSEFPPTPSFALKGGVHRTPSSSPFWVPRTLDYTDPHATSIYFPVGTNPFEFTWS